MSGVLLGGVSMRVPSRPHEGWRPNGYHAGQGCPLAQGSAEGAMDAAQGAGTLFRENPWTDQVKVFQPLSLTPTGRHC